MASGLLGCELSSPPVLISISFFTVTAHCSLLTAYCSLLTAHCLLLTAHCLLLTAHCSLLTAHRSLLTAYCSPLTAHCSLLTNPPASASPALRLSQTQRAVSEIARSCGCASSTARVPIR